MTELSHTSRRGVADVAGAPRPRRALPFAAFEWMIAMRYLRARRASGSVSAIAVISFLGIMLGVAALIVVMSVFNGFHKDLVEKLVGFNGHIFVQGVDANLKDYDRIASELEKLQGVALAVPSIEAAAAVGSPYAQTGAAVRGIEGKDLLRLPGIAGHVRGGTLAGFDDSEGVVIGKTLAAVLDVRVGDNVTLGLFKGVSTPFGIQPRQKKYKVDAIFEAGTPIFDNNLVVMPLKEAQLFFDKDNEVTTIEVFIKHPEQIDQVLGEISLEMHDQFIMTDWRQTNKAFFDAIEVERNVVFIIVALVVLVAALNIVSGLIMLVKDKGSAIAILRTMGATRGAIMRVFLIAGTAISVFGTAAGVVIGCLIAANADAIKQVLSRALHMNLFSPEIYYLSKLPSDLEGQDVATIVVATLVISLVATLYPSWRAAKLDPVEALRYE